MKKRKYFALGVIGTAAVSAALALKKHVMPEAKNDDESTPESFVAEWLNKQVSKSETPENILLSLYKIREAVDTAINSLK